jgi:hypothetical protein
MVERNCVCEGSSFAKVLYQGNPTACPTAKKHGGASAEKAQLKRFWTILNSRAPGAPESELDFFSAGLKPLP